MSATRAEFLRAYGASLDDVLQRADGHIFDKARDASSLLEQSLLLDARAVLLNQHIALKRQLLSGMEQLLNRSFQTAYSTFRPSYYHSLDASSLSLVDVATFEDELQIDLMTKQLRDAAEDPLRDLNIRIALLFEQDDIKERENPFRPYLFARCTVMALEAIHVSQDLIMLLAQQLGLELSKDIVVIYDALNELLARNGIAAQLQLKIRKSPEAVQVNTGRAQAEAENSPLPAARNSEQGVDQRLRSQYNTWSPITREVVPANRADQLLEWVQKAMSHPHAGGVSTQAAGVGAAQVAPFAPGFSGSAPNMGGGMQSPASESVESRKGWLAEAQAVGAVLRNFFAEPAHGHDDFYPGNFNRFGAGHAATETVSSPLTDSIQALQQSIPANATALQDEDGQIRNLILEHRTELNEKSRDIDEQMVIDIVAMLFEFILRDTQVPAEVRAQLGRLQFLVLKIALQDPAFFTRKSHPARLLVNRIGSIVQDLQQLDPDGKRITDEICRIVEVLLSDLTGDVSLFAQMLDEFDVFVAAELRAADQQIDRAVQVVQNAENRTLQFARTTAMIAGALSGLKVDNFLHEFLVNTWARVVERAARTDPAQAMRFRLMVPDLIWSIVPKITERDRKELFGLIPGLLDTLREGLTLLGWTTRETQDLVSWLVDSHRHALRVTNLPAPVPPRSYIDNHFEQFVNASEDDSPHPSATAGELPLDGKLLDEATSEMEVQLNVLDSKVVFGPDEPAGDKVPGLAGDDADLQCNMDEVFQRLRNGVTIEISLDGHPTQARLNWVSPTASHLVLSIDDVPTLSVISVKVFRRLFAAQRVRFLEDAPLFERAVHSLLDSADHLDHQAEPVAS